MHLIPGRKYRLKTYEQIKQRYPDGYPRGMTGMMQARLGSVVTIASVYGESCDLVEEQASYMWHIDSFLPLTSPKGNEY